MNRNFLEHWLEQNKRTIAPKKIDVVRFYNLKHEILFLESMFNKVDNKNSERGSAIQIILSSNYKNIMKFRN